MTRETFFVAGLRPIHDIRGRAWLARASRLAQAFSREVNGRDPCAEARDGLHIHLAARALWKVSKGKPCFSQLDPDVLDEVLAHVPAWQLESTNACVTLYAFFCFLVKHGHLSRAAAIEAQDRFLPRVRPQLEAAMRVLEELRQHTAEQKTEEPPMFD